MAPQGSKAVRAGALRCDCGRWLEPRQAQRVSFVALQVAGPHPQYPGVVIVLGVHGIVGFAAGLNMQVLVPPFPALLSRIKITAPCRA